MQQKQQKFLPAAPDFENFEGSIEKSHVTQWCQEMVVQVSFGDIRSLAKL